MEYTNTLNIAYKILSFVKFGGRTISVYPLTVMLVIIHLRQGTDALPC